MKKITTRAKVVLVAAAIATGFGATAVSTSAHTAAPKHPACRCL